MIKKTSRRNFIKILADCGISIAGLNLLKENAFSRGTDTGKPNLLFIFSDQHRACSTGCYGNDQVKTPHLDKFASQGMVLENTFSPTPVCVPMRVASVTGLLGCHTGSVTNGAYPDHKKFKTIAHVFKQAGYACGYIGKWHMGKEASEPGSPIRFGFDDFWLIRKSKKEAHFQWSVTDGKKVIQEKGFEPDGYASHALDFLKTYKDKPFCLYVSWTPPHAPYNSPEEYRHYGNIKLRPNVPAGEASDYAKESLAGYYGLVEGCDAAFGKITDELDRLGLAENTIVVYTSDHGDMLGSHGFKAKRWPYEESIHIPFIIRWPGKIKAGSRTDMLFSVIDFFPTLARLAGLTVPDGLDGKDFSAKILGEPGAKEQDAVYLMMHYGYVAWPGWRGVRTKKYSYTRVEDRPWFLYDLEKDPYQMNNLVEKEKTLVKQFDDLTLKLMKDYNDSWRGFPKTGDFTKWERQDKKNGRQSLGGEIPVINKEEETSSPDEAERSSSKKKKKKKKKRSSN